MFGLGLRRCIPGGIASLFLIFSLSGFAEINKMNFSKVPNDYDFPYIRPNIATLSGSLLKSPKNLKFTTYKLRNKNRSNKFKFRFYKGRGPTQEKSITFVLGGIGAEVSSSLANFIADKISKKGKSAIVVPSTYTEGFADAISSTGYTGNLKEDSADLFLAMHEVLWKIKRENRQNFEKVNLIGISLGALTGAHLAALAEEPLYKIRFHKVLLINPPVDLAHGLRYLDNSTKAGEDIRFFRNTRVLTRLLLNIPPILKNVEFMNEQAYKDVSNVLSYLTDIELNNLIADGLKTSLKDVTLASQHAHDLKVIPRRPGRRDSMYHYKKMRRRKFISNLGFEDYIQLFLVPYYQEVLGKKDYDFDKINQEASMYFIEDHLRNAENVFLMHNEDDFLLRQGIDLEYLKDIFKHRARIYPRGGHVGNLWYPDNLKAINEFLDMTL